MTDFTDKYSVLRDFFGHTDFHEGQEPLIDALLSGRDAAGIMPTGAGKSLCYQIPALMLDGITIVISPLISLMKDQVNSLIQSGVRAAYLNSSLTPQQYNTALSNAMRGMYKLIYVAPERLCTQSFLELARTVKISLVAVDEAHCVSQWGQDFRPHYMRIPEFLSQLPYRPTVGAFTATATDQVREDIIRLLCLREPLCVTTGFDRKNLYFGVLHERNKYEAAKRIISENSGTSAIIYCSTRKAVEEVSEKLTADGIPCTRYHAGLSPEERKKNQDDFIYDRVELIAATNAFGMGIDKSNVGLVLHYNMPKNIENYYQEAGRAGRDGSEAKCILLYSPKDVMTNKFLIENSNDNPDLDDETAEQLRRRDYAKLGMMSDYCNTGRCLRQFILDYFGEKRKCTCGNCSNCSGETELTDVTLEAQKILSCIYRLHQRNLHFGAVVVSAVLTGSERNDKVKKFGLDTLSTFGIMKSDTTTRIRTMIRFLQAEGFIAEAEHSTLTLTRRGAQLLMNREQKVEMRLPAKSREKAVTAKPRDVITAFDKMLFDRLKKLRARLAAEASVPAYIVFGDQALREMCVKLPVTQSDFMEISGVGRVKQERYGAYFTSEIQKYLRENPDKKGQSPESPNGTLSELIAAGAESLRAVNEELPLTRLCDEILTQLGLSADNKLVFKEIKSWLKNENYLTEIAENGKTRIAATILSDEAGIVEQEKISSMNRSYKTVVFPPKAQEFVFENLGEIFGNS
ncbi:DNA helicase RecQ [Ruminococcus albus]|uniref:DNA helicase RecQ n=1 Tax=Ruminococcus albus 8 TaxID=246199 RepID=E9SF81_RUMAL|nr:DNA helicase RecQ [Ruminococcus albus]EGC02086.1 ATP-dependent DNA helicase RecQ [Ruminococcus albus 8]MCC3350872.1 DNA helicase RecQ [Ruminococcus albus 8]